MLHQNFVKYFILKYKKTAKYHYIFEESLLHNRVSKTNIKKGNWCSIAEENI